ncbi:unnamed protein product, partial [Phaeothamnion confervicola]
PADEAETVAVVGLLAACVRGSPHCRQRLRGLRSHRALYRCLLGMLGPNSSAELVTRALSALTRLVAGDELEERVFQRGNAEQTAAVAFNGLL